MFEVDASLSQTGMKQFKSLTISNKMHIGMIMLQKDICVIEHITYCFGGRRGVTESEIIGQIQDAKEMHP